MAEKIKQDLSIGRNLRRLRLRAGFTQERAAIALQLRGIPVSREMISQMEQGKYSIRISVLLALKELYHAEFADFFEGLEL